MREKAMKEINGEDKVSEETKKKVEEEVVAEVEKWQDEEREAEQQMSWRARWKRRLGWNR